MIDSSRSIRVRISVLLWIEEVVFAFTGGGTKKLHVIPRVAQLEHGWTRLHFSFLDRHDWHETGSGRTLSLCMLEANMVGMRMTR